MKKNYKLTVSYDGSRYYGWEHQKSTPLTIQGKLEAVLTEMAGTAADVTGAGRTDAGVHAKAMTASVQLDTELSEEEIRDYLNRYLPDDIGVTDVRIAAERFHARYSAVGKTYCYSCWVGENKPVFERKYLLVLEKTPDLARMQEAAALLTGTHDYNHGAHRGFHRDPETGTLSPLLLSRKRISAAHGPDHDRDLAGGGLREAGPRRDSGDSRRGGPHRRGIHRPCPGLVSDLC